MAKENKQLVEEILERKHYGKLVAMVIVGVLVVAGGVYGVFFRVGAGKVAYVAPQKEAFATAVIVPMALEPTEAFVVTDISKTSAPQKATGVIDAKTLAAPTNFKSFAYDATVGKTISVSGTCHDAYYTLLIFDAKDDYRMNPGAARSNRAFECGGTRLFTIKMDLRDINLLSGNYYLFVADQGSKGSWYNPR